MLVWISVLALGRVLARDAQIARVVADGVARDILQPLEKGVRFRMIADHVLPILIPLATRPEYFRQVVAALNNATGLKDSLVVFSQDGNDPEITDLALNQLQQPANKLHLWHHRPWFGLPSLKDNEYGNTFNFQINCISVLAFR